MTDFDGSAGSADTGTFAPIVEGECRELLSVGVIGRIGFNDADGIHIIPLNYLYLDGVVYLRVSATSGLGELAKGCENVAFEVDYIDDLVKQAWSVLVKGRIGAVTDTDELNSLQSQQKLEPWALGDRQLYLRLEPAAITGRRVKRNAR